MSTKLTQGCIQAIMRGENVDRPIVQLLNHKRISSGSSTERYRVIISDGIHFNSYAMLATQLNDKIRNGELPENTIISLDQYVPNDLPSGKGMRKILVILNLSVLVKGDVVGAKIGNPINYEEVSDSTQSTAPLTNASTVQPSVVARPTPQSSPMTNGYNKPQNTSYGSADTSRNILPIIGINPYQNKWTIKARVVSKTNIRTWSNARSEGKLFSVDLVDESGAIRGTAFNNACDKFYDMLEVNKVFYISRCAIKPANKKFTTIAHDFELTFNPDTQVMPCTDDDNNIPQLTFNFTPLSALKDIAENSFVDIIGICKSASDVQNLVARSTKREFKKRDIVLVDQSNTSISLALWDTLAEEFDASQNPVVAVKGAKVTEFGGGKSASVSQSSVFQLNPDIPQAHQLRGWYDSLGDSHEFNSISNRVAGDGGGSGKLMTLKEALENQVGTQDKADYFGCEATVLFIQSERAIYQACPTKDCKKKLLDQNNGMYRCEKCCQEFPNFEYRLMLNAQICDWTGNQWVSLFQEQAETLLGATATEIGNSREAYDGDYDSYFRKPLFKTFEFRIRAKMDTFNNENRLRMSVVNLKPVNYKESCKRLISEIKALSGVSIASH